MDSAIAGACDENKLFPGEPEAGLFSGERYAAAGSVDRFVTGQVQILNKKRPKLLP